MKCVQQFTKRLISVKSAIWLSTNIFNCSLVGPVPGCICPTPSLSLWAASGLNQRYVYAACNRRVRCLIRIQFVSLSQVNSDSHYSTNSTYVLVYVCVCVTTCYSVRLTSFSWAKCFRTRQSAGSWPQQQEKQPQLVSSLLY